MTLNMVSDIIRSTLYVVITSAAPLLLISLSVGLTVSIFQTVTSIQEQTLTFVPKLIAIFAVLIILGGWMLGNMTDFMENLWSDFSIYLH